MQAGQRKQYKININNNININSNKRQIDESMHKHGKYLKHRRYHKASVLSQVQQAFIDYLLQQGYDVTLKVFQQQMQQKGISHNNMRINNNINDNKYRSIQSPQMTQIPPTNTNTLSYIISQMQQIQHQKCINQPKYQKWLQLIKQSFTGTKAQWIKIQFMLIVWKISISSNLQHESNILKQYIQENGIVLSESPELLPYFALPYMGEPRGHPYLKRIYTQEFIQEIVSLLTKYISNNNNINNNHNNNNINNNNHNNNSDGHHHAQNQWYVVVKDLINICMHFGQQCTNMKHNHNNNNIKQSNIHEQMLQRVKKYKQVIANNQNISDSHSRQSYHQQQLSSSQQSSIGVSELSRLLFVFDSRRNYNYNQEQQPPPVAERQSVNKRNKQKRLRQIQLQVLDYKRVKSVLLSINPQSIQQYRRCCLILHALNQRLTQSINATRRSQISRYIQYDILSLNSKQKQKQKIKINNVNVNGQISYYKQIECLKLVNTICLYSKADAGIRYIGDSQQYMHVLRDIVQEGVKVYGRSANRSRVNSNNSNNSSRVGNKQTNNNNNNLYNAKGNQNSDIALQQRVLQCLGIIQKVSTLKPMVIKLTNTKILSTLLQYLQNYQHLPSTILTYILAIILNLLLHPQNKQLCSTMQFTCPQSQSDFHSASVSRSKSRSKSKINNANKQQTQISFLQLIIRIWQHRLHNNTRFYRSQVDSQLQSFVYSIMYMLLGLQINKDKAKHIGLIQKLDIFMDSKRAIHPQHHSNNNNNGQQQQVEQELAYYNKVIPQLVRVYHSKQQLQTAQQWEYQQQSINEEQQQNINDQSEQDDEQSQVKGYLWVGNSILHLSQLQSQQNQQQVLIQYYIKSQEQEQDQKQMSQIHQAQKQDKINTQNINMKKPMDINQRIQINKSHKQTNVQMPTNHKPKPTLNSNLSAKLPPTRIKTVQQQQNKSSKPLPQLQQKSKKKMDTQQNKSAVHTHVNKDINNNNNNNRLRNVSEIYSKNSNILANSNNDYKAGGVYDQKSGYNPAKYQAWKRLKTTKQ